MKKMEPKFTNMNPKVKVGIIIVTYNNAHDVEGCLAGLKKLSQKNCSTEIRVVDNNSSDGTVKAVKDKFPDISVTALSENKGLAKANNFAVKEYLAAGKEYILILNPDTMASLNLVDDLVGFMQKNPGVGICGPKIYFAPGYEYHKERYSKAQLGKVFWYAGGIIDWKNILSSHFGVDEVDEGQFETGRETDFVSGCAMFVSRKVFEKIGFLDENLGMYLEDVDFSVRVKRAGFGVFYAPIKAVWHKNAQSSGVGSLTQDYYTTRNRLYFAVKYAKARAKLAVIRESWKLLWKGRPGQKQGVKDFYAKRFGVAKII